MNRFSALLRDDSRLQNSLHARGLLPPESATNMEAPHPIALHTL